MKTPINKIPVPLTDEWVSEESTPEELSDALRAYAPIMKDLEAKVEQIKSWLEPYIEEAVERGDDKFLSFWSFVRVPRFDKDLFVRTASEEEQAIHEEYTAKIKEIESKYKKVGKVSIRQPMLS